MADQETINNDKFKCPSCFCYRNKDDFYKVNCSKTLTRTKDKCYKLCFWCREKRKKQYWKNKEKILKNHSERNKKYKENNSIQYQNHLARNKKYYYEIQKKQRREQKKNEQTGRKEI